MGATLAKLAIANRDGLTHRELLVLVQMCLIALDESNGDRPARTYWRGRETLAFALGYDVPEGDDDASRKRRRQVLTNVGDVVASLVRKARLERVGTAHRGWQQTYRLHPERHPTTRCLKAPHHAVPLPQKGTPPRESKAPHHGVPEEPVQEPVTTGAKESGTNAAADQSRNAPVVGDVDRDDDDQTSSNEERDEDGERLRRRRAADQAGRLARLRALKADPNASRADIELAAKLAGVDPDTEEPL